MVNGKKKTPDPLGIGGSILAYEPLLAIQMELLKR
jgi:hypothetical protein